MTIQYNEQGVPIIDLHEFDSSLLIDDRWYPEGNYHLDQMHEDFYLNHISMHELGYYKGSHSELATELGLCMSDWDRKYVIEQSEYGTKSMVYLSVFESRILTKYQLKEFDDLYNLGFNNGQLAISKQLYELAQMGEYKAVDKYLEVRGAFGLEQSDTESPVTIMVHSEAVIEHENNANSNVIPITKQS